MVYECFHFDIQKQAIKQEFLETCTTVLCFPHWKEVLVMVMFIVVLVDVGWHPKCRQLAEVPLWAISPFSLPRKEEQGTLQDNVVCGLGVGWERGNWNPYG